MFGALAITFRVSSILGNLGGNRVSPRFNIKAPDIAPTRQHYIFLKTWFGIATIVMEATAAIGTDEAQGGVPAIPRLGGTDEAQLGVPAPTAPPAPANTEDVGNRMPPRVVAFRGVIRDVEDLMVLSRLIGPRVERAIQFLRGFFNNINVIIEEGESPTGLTYERFAILSSTAVQSYWLIKDLQRGDSPTHKYIDIIALVAEALEILRTLLTPFELGIDNVYIRIQARVNIIQREIEGSDDRVVHEVWLRFFWRVFDSLCFYVQHYHPNGIPRGRRQFFGSLSSEVSAQPMLPPPAYMAREPLVPEAVREPPLTNPPKLVILPGSGVMRVVRELNQAEYDVVIKFFRGHHNENKPIEVGVEKKQQLVIENCSNITLIIRGTADRITVSNCKNIAVNVQSGYSKIEVIETDDLILDDGHAFPGISRFTRTYMMYRISNMNDIKVVQYPQYRSVFNKFGKLILAHVRE